MLTNHLNKAKFPGKIILINKDEQIKEAMGLIEGHPHLGFDTETRPSFKKGEFFGVALLQLATPNHALIFQMHRLSDFSLIKELFENINIKKIGVAIRDDIIALQKAFPFKSSGFIELADLARAHNLKNFGLKGMTEEVLNLSLSKKAKLSNWELKDLKEEQKMYAATDAWIGREIYMALNSSCG